MSVIFWRETLRSPEPPGLSRAGASESSTSKRSILCGDSVQEKRTASPPSLKPAPDKKDGGAQPEKRELTPYVAREHPIEEGDPRHDQPRELETTREQVHGRRRDALLGRFGDGDPGDAISLLDLLDDVLAGNYLTEHGVDPV